MVEALAEELIKALAPVLLDGSSAFFTEEDIKAAFATKKETPPNIDAGVDFGMGVTLFEIVNKHMSLQAAPVTWRPSRPTSTRPSSPRPDSWTGPPRSCSAIPSHRPPP
jgi:hypothetical protein